MPTLVSTSLPAASVGSAYSFQFQATGGRPPYVFSYEGSLPDGLTLSSSGLLSGTPTVGATFNFSICVESDDGPEIDPKVMIRWSNDWARTWSNEYQRSMGKQGEYTKRVIKRGTGIARQRVFEASGTAAVPLVINACYLRDPGVRKT